MGIPVAMRRRPANQGFTLLELLVVISLIALAIGIVAANYTGATATAELKSETRKLMSLLRQSRVAAMSRSRILTLEVGDAGNRYRIAPDGEVINLPADMTLVVSPEQSQWGVAGAGGILFFPDGGSSGGRCRLSSPAGDTVVTVNWLTGEVALDESG